MTQLDNRPSNSHDGESGKKPNWLKRKDVQQVAALWVILSIGIGWIAGEVISRSMGTAASDVMEETITMMKVFTWVSAPIAGFVGAICLKMLSTKLHRGDLPPPDADHSIEKSPRAAAVWIVLSSLLCLFAVVFGLVVMQEDAKTLQASEAVHVNVMGNQWVWNFDYPNNNVRSQQLYLPVGKPVVFHISSKDVKHSFWIVQMGVKMDANPGYTTELAVTPNKIGVFDVRCAELCGLLHAYMQNQVHVVSKEDYDAWLISQGGNA
jgi:cytochrome c oxidase subunit 2